MEKKTRVILWTIVVIVAIVALWTVGVIQEREFRNLPDEDKVLVQDEKPAIVPCEGEKCA